MLMILTAVMMQKMSSVTKLVWIVVAVVVHLNWEALLLEVLECVSCIFLFSMWFVWCLYQVLLVLLWYFWYQAAHTVVPCVASCQEDVYSNLVV